MHQCFFFFTLWSLLTGALALRIAKKSTAELSKMAIEIEYDGFKELGNPKGSAEETREHSFFGPARRHQTFLPWIHQISFNLASTFTPDSKQIDAQQECLVWVSGAVILVAMIMMKRQEDDGLALFMVLWCVSGIAMNLINKIATTVFPLPLTLLLLQMMIGVFVLLALFGPFQLIEELWDKSESVWRWSLITVPFAGMLITSILAFQEGHALTVLVLRNLLPLISLFLERVFSSRNQQDGNHAGHSFFDYDCMRFIPLCIQRVEDG